MDIFNDFLVALLLFSILLGLCLLWRYVWLANNNRFHKWYYDDYAGFHEVTNTFLWGFVRETDTIWDWEEWKEANYSQWNREFLDGTDVTPFDHRRYPRWQHTHLRASTPGGWGYEEPNGTRVTSDEPQES